MRPHSAKFAILFTRSYIRLKLLCSSPFQGTRTVSAKDYYEVLTVSKNASASDVRKSHYALHPDTNKEDVNAERKIQEVQRAFEVLKDEEKRLLYDQVGPDAFEQAASGGGTDAGLFHSSGFDPFEEIFGGGSEFFQNVFRDMFFGGLVIKTSLEISLTEAVRGCIKTLNFQTTVPCETVLFAHGTGVPPGTRPETCRNCRGIGMTFMKHGPFRLLATCSQCGGSGIIVKNLCKSCKGWRVVRGTKSPRVDVMPENLTVRKLLYLSCMLRVDNNDTIEVYRGGGADLQDGQPGDLFVTIKAILGGTIQVPTLTGDVVVKVRPGTQPGQKVVLKNLTQRLRALIEEFAKEEQGEYDEGAKASGASRWLLSRIIG